MVGQPHACMRAYVGQTRSRALGAKLTAAGLGECTQRDEYPPRRSPWFLDNGAFKDWRAGQPFNAAEWRGAVADARAAVAAPAPEWTVTPDIVAQGWDSLAFSLDHVGELDGMRPYLVTQDGMEQDTPRVERAVADGRFAGLFVGGSLPWKLATGSLWVDVAHGLGLPCHIGRVGTVRRVRWAREIGADSIDSCLPLWSSEQLRAFLHALHEEQGSLFA